MKGTERNIAYFVSPHGYGHAARAAAVMDALHEIDPGIRFHILTKVPRSIFVQSLSGPFTYYELVTDIGLVQGDPLHPDLRRTLKALDAFLPFQPNFVRDLAARLTTLGCELAVCDIAPVGILAARKAGIPSVLVENFTWDWIYEGHLDRYPAIRRHIFYLRQCFEASDFRIQAEPVCAYREADLVTEPISRRFRASPAQVRSALGIPTGTRCVTITMGGVPGSLRCMDRLRRRDGVRFVVFGPTRSMRREANLLLLPRESNIYFPDLIRASDAAVGKLGYSTLAEIYQADVPFGYVASRGFRESRILAAYIEKHLSGWPISEEAFHRGDWVSGLDALLGLPRMPGLRPNGAEQAAAFLHARLADERTNRVPERSP